VASQRGVVGRDDKTAGFGDDAPPYERHHERWRKMAEMSAGLHQQPVTATDRGRDAGADESGEPRGGGARTVDAEHLVSEPLHELAAGWVGDETTETMLALAFGPCLGGGRRAQQLVGDDDRLFGTRDVVHEVPSWRACRASPHVP
jgi:hypothetical protein